MIRRHMVLDVILYVMILLVAFLVLLENGCQWAEHERTIERTPATEKRITAGKRYFRVRTKDGAVRYGWLDETGKLHLVKEGAK